LFKNFDRSKHAPPFKQIGEFGESHCIDGILIRGLSDIDDPKIKDGAMIVKMTANCGMVDVENCIFNVWVC